MCAVFLHKSKDTVSQSNRPSQWVLHPCEVNGSSIPVQVNGCCIPVQVNGCCVPAQVNGCCIPVQVNGCCVPAQVNGAWFLCFNRYFVSCPWSRPRVLCTSLWMQQRASPPMCHGPETQVVNADRIYRCSMRTTSGVNFSFCHVAFLHVHSRSQRYGQNNTQQLCKLFRPCGVVLHSNARFSRKASCVTYRASRP